MEHGNAKNLQGLWKVKIHQNPADVFSCLSPIDVQLKCLVIQINKSLESMFS